MGLELGLGFILTSFQNPKYLKAFGIKTTNFISKLRRLNNSWIKVRRKRVKAGMAKKKKIVWISEREGLKTGNQEDKSSFQSRRATF